MTTEEFRQWLKDRNMTQLVFAEAVAWVTLRSVNRWANGRKIPHWLPPLMDLYDQKQK